MRGFMPAVWLSTLQNNRDLHALFSARPASAEQNDQIVQLSDSEQASVNSFFDNFQYPVCGSCQQPVCGNKTTCGCKTNQHYQEEYLAINTEINTAEQALQSLENSPFRQSRNAAGFAGSLLSGSGLFFKLVACSAAVTYAVLALPLLIGAYVYRRGKLEEQQINAELSAEWMDKKISLLRKHQEAVQLQCESKLAPSEKAPVIIKPHKEKRDIPGNSLSHFIVPALSTTGTATSFFSIFLPALAGGPIAWGIAIGIGVCVGCYFAYKRYSHLTRKIDVEKKINALTAREKNMGFFKPTPTPSPSSASPEETPALGYNT
jgi:hypothetical protein